MRVAVTGTTGRVGTALARWFSDAGHEVVELPRAEFDLASRESIERVLAGLEVEVFLHPAGITSVDAAEDDPALAMRVNADAAGEIARWAAERGVKLVYFSTDYVFGGETPGLRGEEEPAGPLGIYGASKRAGELAVLAASPDHLVCRVSWVFGPEKASFVDQVIDNALAGKPLSAVADKVSLPTSTGGLCEWISLLIEKRAAGIFHLCHPGEPVSWHGLADFTVGILLDEGLLAERPEIAAVRLDDAAGFRARRPRFTAMATDKLEARIGTLQPWPAALEAYLRQRCRELREGR